MDRHDFADAYLLRGKGVGHALGNKQAQAVFIQMLQLTPAA
jgi:hypothetical protein